MKYKSHLRSRIALYVLAPGIACSLLVGIYLTYAMLRDVDQHEQEMSNAYSEQIASQSFASLQSGDTTTLQNIAQLALEYPMLRAITFYDANQQEIVHAGPRHPPATNNAIDETTALLFSDTPTEIKSSSTRQRLVPVIRAQLGAPLAIDHAAHPHVKNSGNISGWVRLEFSHNFLLVSKYKTVIVDCSIVVLILAVGFWFSAPFSDGIAETLRNIARSVRAIGTNHEEKPEIPFSEIIELQDLANAIGEMQSAMAEQQSNLHYHIEQSTQDLRETLETIEIQNIELDLARREAVQANRIKSEFLANTSHEIRTPLNSIIGFSKLLLKTPLSGQQQDYLQNIRKSSENLLTIINDVLDLSKIEAGKLVLDYVAFDINETLEEILQILAPGAHEKGLELLYMVYSDVPRHLLGDPLRLKQVLTNLISNAIKFSDRGNVVVRIAVENADKQQALLKIEINDAGKGLPNNNNAIFSAFTQLDSSSTREHAGTGLGLAISQKIVEQMGGDIGYNSEPGNTTFWFTVRFDIADHSVRSPTGNLLQGRHILVYDNERLCRLAISHSLTDWGVQPVLADSIEQVIPALERYTGGEHNIDAIVLGLPVRCTRPEIEKLLHSASHIRAQYRCPVILCAPASVKQEVSFGAEFIPKPITESRLFQTLCSVLDTGMPIADNNLTTQCKTNSNGMRILVVDDNPPNLKLISTMLRDLGAEVLEAGNGEEAVQVFRENTVIDLVFMDVQMPVMDGIEATKRIRQLESSSGRHTPIIALTAHALAEQRQQLLMAGLDDYLSKPASEQQLLNMMEKWHKPENLPINTAKRVAQDSVNIRKLANCVDRQAALQASGQRTEVAAELLTLLLKTLDSDRQEILAAIDQNNLENAEILVHKLHGASCYCGVTELKNCCNAMETLIKKNMPEHLPDVVVRFDAAVNTLLLWRQSNDPDVFFQTKTPEV